jgi:hypothetical protein
MPLLQAPACPYRCVSHEIHSLFTTFFIQSSAILPFSCLELDQDTSHFIKYAVVIRSIFASVSLQGRGKFIDTEGTGQEHPVYAVQLKRKWRCRKF